MPAERLITVDGNEAAARVAFASSEVIAIYPITPASPMGELADQWSSQGRRNLFGDVPVVIEMQSEGGAAGVVHGALQGGALSTTFTASQGLLLMLPDMFKIAGELTPMVMHVAARAVATHALSIFGDHSDVMAARSTGWALLASATVQEAQDLALVAHAATLESRVPFLHFFDGFRTSHELATIVPLEDEDLLALLPRERIAAHRARSLDPDRPVLRGTSQNPDVFFQAREAANPFYAAVPAIVQGAMDRLAARTGRRYRLFDLVGHPRAERVIVVMGSGAGAVEETVARRASNGEPVALVAVRLFQPFSARDFCAALPPTVRSIAVLDRTKEPGAVGEPLYQAVVTALHEEWPRDRGRPEVIGGRFGLASKEFTPAMAAAVLDELATAAPRRRFTVGIHDDVTHSSLTYDTTPHPEPADRFCALFHGLGSDGTVSANKSTAHILSERAGLRVQAYFVYDSRKAGATTVSHLRIAPGSIGASYQVQRAHFVACHQFGLLERLDVLERAAEGAIFLLNAPYPADEVWERLPREVQETIIARRLRFFAIDAHRVAREAGLGGRINTVMQACFFALTDFLPLATAREAMLEAVERSYGKAGEVIVERNELAIDLAGPALAEVCVPDVADATRRRLPAVSGDAPEFVGRVTRLLLEGKGDSLPVSALPVDGTFPTGTARFEKRSLAPTIPIWDAALCIECGLCSALCPHAAIRARAYPEGALAGAPPDFPSRPWRSKERPGHAFTIQVAPDDCTGCGICVDVCPARSKEIANHKAIDMLPKLPHLERERRRFEHFLSLPSVDRAAIDEASIPGSQLLDPLFEFSGACAGCGETPYLKLLTQLFGDRLLVANATGCSSIYGGNLPTTPWSKDAAGRGPAWSNSLFEDNAEFGLGLRLAQDAARARAERGLHELAGVVGEDLVREILAADQGGSAGIAAQRERVAELRARLADRDDPAARELAAVADALVDRSVWIVGGDGWAYDIGFGGLDHVLASGRDVNILVLDTEVYSNTGGQASKATPRGAVAKFAAGGRATPKKDLGRIASDYGNVYVAQVAIGASPRQTLRAFVEAESYRGPSLIIAYSHCIAHGIDMSRAMSHQKMLLACGYWPLYRHDPRLAGPHGHPFQLDSRRPDLPFREFARTEARFAQLERARPEEARRLFALAQADIDERWRTYEQLAGLERSVPGREGGPP